MLTINKSNFAITRKTPADAGDKRCCHKDWMLTKGHERTPGRKGRLREPASVDYRSQIK